jgi:hypothetical protein
MFTLKESNTFEWPIRAKVPEGGKHKTITFTGTFRVLSSAEINDLNGDGSDPDGALKVLNAALVRFDLPVEDADGDTVIDDDERRAILLKHPFLVNAASEAFAAGISGRIAKN